MSAKDKTLLVVDDEEGITMVVKMTMIDDVGKILIAHNGLEGLEILKNEKVDCVLSDIRMPKMDGIEFIKEVRKTNKDLPFVFYTAFGNKSLMTEALKYGAEDFVDKPLMDGLKDILLRILNRKAAKDGEFISEYQKSFLRK